MLLGPWECVGSIFDQGLSGRPPCLPKSLCATEIGFIPAPLEVSPPSMPYCTRMTHVLRLPPPKVGVASVKLVQDEPDLPCLMLLLCSPRSGFFWSHVCPDSNFLLSASLYNLSLLNCVPLLGSYRRGSPSPVVVPCVALSPSVLSLGQVLVVARKLKLQKAYSSRDSPDEDFSYSCARTDLRLSPYPSAGKEIFSPNPACFNLLYSSISNPMHIYIAQGLRYQILIYMCGFGFEMVNIRVCLVSMLGNCDCFSRLCVYKYGLSNSMLYNHHKFYVIFTTWVLGLVTDQRLMILAAVSPLDVSCVETTNQVSSCWGKERLVSRIGSSLFNPLRDSLSLGRDLKRNSTFQTFLLSCVMTCSRSEDASAITFVRVSVMDHLSKSHCKVTCSELVEEVVGSFELSKCLTTLNCFILLLTFYQGLSYLAYLSLSMFRPFVSIWTLLSAHLGLSDVASPLYSF